MKRVLWSVTCLSPTRQDELLARQNPDGSLVFSAVLKDEQGLLSFLLVPPSAKRTPHTDNVAQGKPYPAMGSPPNGGSPACNLIPMESEISFGA